MNNKLRDIVAAVAISLSQLVPYSAQSVAAQPKPSSGIETIVENSNPEVRIGQYRLGNDYTTKAFDSLYRHLEDYLRQHAKDKEDTTKMVPLKFVNKFPISVMGGILGFTYIGDHSMGKRDDLTGELSWEVDIHESIHTPDEYDTIRITAWIMEEPKPKYIK